MVTKNEFICSFLDYKLSCDNLPADQQDIDDLDDREEPKEDSWFDLEGTRQDDNPNQK